MVWQAPGANTHTRLPLEFGTGQMEKSYLLSLDRVKKVCLGWRVVEKGCSRVEGCRECFVLMEDGCMVEVHAGSLSLNRGVGSAGYE